MLAKHALYQLSYGPLAGVGSGELSSIRLSAQVSHGSVVGPGRLELPTSRLSGVCSNHLSYGPLKRSAQTAGQSRMDAERLGSRSHHSLLTAAAALMERETKTAASRTCLVSLDDPIELVSGLEDHP